MSFQIRVGLDKAIEDASGNLHHTQGMGKPGTFGTMKGKTGGSQLANAPQSLERRSIYELDQE
jgi:hypothetical protein